CRADLLEESHRVEVVAALLDLAALEREEEGSGCLLKLARRRDRSFCGHKRARGRALPGYFQGRLVAAGHGAGYRADSIRERHLPRLEGLDDLLRTLPHLLRGRGRSIPRPHSRLATRGGGTVAAERKSPPAGWSTRSSSRSFRTRRR